MNQAILETLMLVIGTYSSFTFTEYARFKDGRNPSVGKSFRTHLMVLIILMSCAIIAIARTYSPSPLGIALQVFICASPPLTVLLLGRGKMVSSLYLNALKNNSVAILVLITVLFGIGSSCGFFLYLKLINGSPVPFVQRWAAAEHNRFLNPESGDLDQVSIASVEVIQQIERSRDDPDQIEIEEWRDYFLLVPSERVKGNPNFFTVHFPSEPAVLLTNYEFLGAQWISPGGTPFVDFNNPVDSHATTDFEIKIPRDLESGGEQRRLLIGTRRTLKLQAHIINPLNAKTRIELTENQQCIWINTDSNPFLCSSLIVHSSDFHLSAEPGEGAWIVGPNARQFQEDQRREIRAHEFPTGTAAFATPTGEKLFLSWPFVVPPDSGLYLVYDFTPRDSSLEALDGES